MLILIIGLQKPYAKPPQPRELQEQIAKYLIKMLRHHEINFRLQAAERLCSYGENYWEESVEGLLQLFAKEKHTYIRYQAFKCIKVLLLYNSEFTLTYPKLAKQFELLIQKAIQDKSPDIRYEVNQYLKADKVKIASDNKIILQKAGITNPDKYFEQPRCIPGGGCSPRLQIEQLKPIADTLISSLVKLVNNSSEAIEIRKAALNLLSQLMLPQAISAINKLAENFKQIDPAMQLEVLIYSVKYSPITSAQLNYLIKLLDSEEAYKRTMAAVLLSKTPNSLSYLDKLIQLASKDEIVNVRVVSMQIINEMVKSLPSYHDKLVNVLMQNLQSEYWIVKAAAAEALISINKIKPAAMLLTKAKTNKSALWAPDVTRMQAEDALVQIPILQALGAVKSLAAIAVPQIIPMLKNKYTSEEAAKTLGEIGEEAKEAVPSLTRLLNDPKLVVRHEAIIALGKIGTAADSAVTALVYLYKHPKKTSGDEILDSDYSEKTMILQTLKAIDTPKANHAHNQLQQ